MRAFIIVIYGVKYILHGNLQGRGPKKEGGRPSIHCMEFRIFIETLRPGNGEPRIEGRGSRHILVLHMELCIFMGTPKAGQCGPQDRERGPSFSGAIYGVIDIYGFYHGRGMGNPG